MRRFVLYVLAAGVSFSAGFALMDQYERSRVWQADRHESRPVRSANQIAHSNVPESATSTILFEDVASRVGLDFTYYDGAEGNYFIMETTGGGMAVLDCDGDGLQDLFFVNGSRLPVDPSDRRHVSRLFRNHDERGFGDVTRVAGVELVTYGQGAAAGDINEDGFADLLVTSFGRLHLYRNQGDGTWADLTNRAGVSSPSWGTSAAWADLDRDGDLDLYVCTYAQVSVTNPERCERSGIRIHCLPRIYRPQSDSLYRNEGDGRFVPQQREAGIVDEAGRGLGVVIADLNDDAAPDIFVANDTSENFLFLNRGHLRFEELAVSMGAALTGEGETMAGMGIACADCDLNGLPDLFVTNFYEEKNVLYVNQGPAGFLDVSDSTGLGASSRDRLGFGAVFLDADLDGLPDLFVANGHVTDLSRLGIPYKMRPQLYHNRAAGHFDEVSDSVGMYFRQRVLGRGTAVVDIDNNGRPDIVVSHIGDPAALLLNRTSTTGHWLGLELVGTRSSRNARNVTIRVSVRGSMRTYQTIAGGGYLSSSDPRLLVGLGAAEAVDSVTIEWPSGIRQTSHGLSCDRYHRVVESLY